jgi:hypothetical protein
MPHTCISLGAVKPATAATLVAASTTVGEGKDLVLTCSKHSADTATHYLFKFGTGTPVQVMGTGTSAVYTKMGTTPTNAGGDWTCATKNTVGTGPYSAAVTVTITGKFHSSMYNILSYPEEIWTHNRYEALRNYAYFRSWRPIYRRPIRASITTVPRQGMQSRT